MGKTGQFAAESGFTGWIHKKTAAKPEGYRPLVSLLLKSLKRKPGANASGHRRKPETRVQIPAGAFTLFVHFGPAYIMFLGFQNI